MSADNLEHFIITRFNLATSGRESEIRSQEGWLEHRFDLFERYCLPSVAAQSVQNFRWIIHFDENTPDTFKKRISALTKTFPFIPFYTNLLNGWGESITQTFSPKADFVATTRLDSDDALGIDFVEKVQNGILAEGMSAGSYNLQQGLIRYNDSIYAIRHPSNAFFTYLERNSANLKTAHSIKHMEIASAGKVFQLSGPPSWMQIVHDSNVSNKVRGWRVSNISLENTFSGDAGKNIKQITAASAVLENISLGVLRYLRDRTYSAIRKIKAG